MIEPPVRQTLGIGSPRAYAAAMAGLWIDLELTLARLDSLARDAERLQDDRETLPALQYELHCAAELVTGLNPPQEAALVLVAALLGLWLLVAFTLAGTVAGSVLLRP